MATQDSRHTATFFVSTGRCGTQWLADKLPAHYGDLAVATHEPVHHEYEPRRYFSAYRRGENPELTPAIAAHLQFIEDTLRTKDYIEAGWPVYGVLPYFLRRLEGRVRVVHLYRNPFEMAASMATHGFYDKGEWSEAMLIRPADQGVIQPELNGSRWNAMPEFERCLFWWTEINDFGLRLHREFPQVPWLSIRFEDMLKGDSRAGLIKLLEFLQLPVREDFLASREQRTDKFHYKSEKKIETIPLEQYPKTVAVMEQLGYQYDPAILPELQKRYSKTLLHKWASRTRRGLLSLSSRLGGAAKNGG